VGNGNMTASSTAARRSRAAAIELIEQAFAQAQRKQGVPVHSMTLAVLKNRLLQLTQRHFNPADYGANDLRPLLATLAPDVIVTADPKQPIVELHLRPADERELTTPAATTSEATLATSSEALAPPSIEQGRIRDDL